MMRDELEALRARLSEGETCASLASSGAHAQQAEAESGDDAKPREFGQSSRGFCTGAGAERRVLAAEDVGAEMRAVFARKYRMSVCIHTGRVSGTVRIEKLLNCDETRRFTADPAYEAEVRSRYSRYGPDEFVLGLEGPELHSLTLYIYT